LRNRLILSLRGEAEWGGTVNINADLARSIDDWDAMSRWEKSELGRDLRREGLSYGEIMELIDVKKSTLATWCRDVPLTAAQLEAIKERTGQVTGLPRDTQWRRREAIELLRKNASEQALYLATNPDWVAGVVLYWAEGGKGRNRFQVSNSDPLALRLFIRWVRTYLNHEAEFALQLHLHEGNDDAAARAYWATVLDLPRVAFYKTFIKPKGTGHRKNHLKHGVCRVNVRRSSDMWQRTMAWVDYVSSSLGH
jgi:hypothetical protein